MVIGHRVDDHEVLQVVLVGGIVPVPGHDIEWGDILIAKEAEKMILAPNAFVAVMPVCSWHHSLLLDLILFLLFNNTILWEKHNPESFCGCFTHPQTIPRLVTNPIFLVHNCSCLWSHVQQTEAQHILQVVPFQQFLTQM